MFADVAVFAQEASAPAQVRHPMHQGGEGEQWAIDQRTSWTKSTRSRLSHTASPVWALATVSRRSCLGGATAKLGAQSAPHFVSQGVEISVRPEVTLHSKSKTTELVGGIKLHFSKNRTINEEQADYVSAMVHSYCETHLWKHGQPFGGHCMVIDLASGKVYPGVKAVKQRLKDVANACGQIAALWPGITK